MDKEEHELAAAMAQLDQRQRILDYDTKEFTVELLVSKFGSGGDNDDIFVPHYQRRFNWDTRRQSRMIESLLMGLPLPFLFFGDMDDGRLEVVDGHQRLSTCVAFLKGKLELEGLERLDKLNGFTFDDISMPQQRRFKNRTIRSVVLSRKATEEDRRDLFDRINTGSLLAEPAETRRGSVMGPITSLIDELASDRLFRRLCPVTESAQRKREGEELITRFFTFSDGLEGYRDRMADFQVKWLRSINKRALQESGITEEYRSRFETVMSFVDSFFPYGFRKSRSAKTTPRVRFDAIAVGTWNALERTPGIRQTGPVIPVTDWLDSDDFFLLTASGSANVRSKIANRTEYVALMIEGHREQAQALAPGSEEEE